MSIEFAYRFQEVAPRSGLRELDRVALTAAIVGDDGEALDIGAEGTIVGVSEGGDLYIVEFAEPAGTLAAVEAHELRRVEPTSS